MEKSQGAYVVADLETLFEFEDDEAFDYNRDVTNWSTSSNFKGRRACLLSIYGSDINQVYDVYHNQPLILQELIKYRYVFFHNLSYDGNFIVKLMQKLGWKEFNQVERKRGYSYEVQILGKEYYWIKIYKGFKIITQIRDSYRFIPYAVKALPKLMGLDLKKEWDESYDAPWMYDYWIKGISCPRLGDYKRYCYIDSEIVFKSLNKLFMFLETQCFITPGEFLKKFSTLSSFALYYYEVLNPRVVPFLKLRFYKGDDYEGLRSVYKGGFCDVNPDYAYKDMAGVELTSYDLNSAYPAVLRNEAVPLCFEKAPGLVPTMPIYKIRAVGELVANSNLRFIFRDVFTNCNSDSLGHPAKFGDFSIFYLFEEEFNFFKKYYDGEIYILEKIKTWGAKIDEGGYVDQFYSLKSKFKIEGNKAFYTITKLLLNALTGKFGQRPQFDNRVIFCDKEIAALYNYDFQKKEYSRVYRPLKESNDSSYYVAKKYFDEEENNWESIECNNFLIIAFITMRTRCKLYKIIEAAKIDNWLYSDTDSVKLKVKISDAELVGTGLGQFKDEGSVNISEFYHPKAYYWGSKYTFGGCDLDKIKNIDYRSIVPGFVVKNGKKSIKNVLDGIILDSADYIIC